MSWVLDLCAFDCLLYHRRCKARLFYQFILKYGNQSQGKESEYVPISACWLVLQKQSGTCRSVIMYCNEFPPGANVHLRGEERKVWCIHGHVVNAWGLFSPSSLSSGSPVVGQKSGGRTWNTVFVCVVHVCHLGARCFTPRETLSGLVVLLCQNISPSHIWSLRLNSFCLCCSTVRRAVLILAVPRLPRRDVSCLFLSTCIPLSCLSLRYLLCSMAGM